MNIKTWINALRIKTLPLSVSGILVGLSLASVQLNYLQEDQNFWMIFFLAVMTTLLFQVLSNLSNDYADFEKGTDNAQRIGPERGVQSGGITVDQMKKASYFVAFLAFFSAIILIYFAKSYLTPQSQLIFILLACLSILAAIGYTVGKRAYGYKGFGDLMVFLFFGLLSVIGSYSLFGFPFEYSVLIFGCAIGFWSTAVLNLNNLRDVENDRNFGKKTIVVQLGFPQALYYHLLLISMGYLSWFIGLFLLVKWSQFYPFFLCMIPSFFLFGHLNRVFKIKDPKELNSELGKVALITFLSSLMFFVCIRLFIFMAL